MYVKLLIILSLLVPTLANGVPHKQLRLPPENEVFITGCSRMEYQPPHPETQKEKRIRDQEGFDADTNLSFIVMVDCKGVALHVEVTPTDDIID